MAGLSTKAIKTRIKSMQSTRQITKAMELVAASKLRSAQAKAISSRPYFQTLYAAMDEIADTNNDFTSPYLHANPNGKPAYVVIAGDRGLAGGYNNNILKLAYSQMEEGAAVLPIGKKAVEYFKRKNVTVITESYAEAASVSIGDCYTIAKMLADGFLDEASASSRSATRTSFRCSRRRRAHSIFCPCASPPRSARRRTPFCMSPAARPFSTPSFRNTWAVFCMARCASRPLPSRPPAAPPWIPPPKTPTRSSTI